MPQISRRVFAGSSLALAAALAGCSSGGASGTGGSDGGGDPGGGTSADGTEITIEHAFGTTTIPAVPEVVTTVAWANHEVPLALGVVPAGMAAANFGDDDSNGLLPWVQEALEELGAETPVLFDETDGIDFEGVADTAPEVILAAYSGLTQEDCDTLTQIAPTVPYPEIAWGTPWREMITVNATGMGRASEGDQLVTDLEAQIEEAVAAHPAITGKNVMFLTHVDTTDLSEVSFYTAHDTRTMFFEDLGMAIAPSVVAASEETEEFSSTVSAENADVFSDVEIIVTYGDESLLAALEADPLLSQMPAVSRGAVVNLPSNSPLGTAANPTPLAIPYILEDYLAELDRAASASA
ncbi:ABC transporter substrate-binding protein [Brachybacterium fresconis]|uniref:Iron complex transport system substrate-binding protein n=1 Tax=Brachybacterium fresconis TaxID=173363 RepID=A0ABS4YHV2_9MICO|nr:ABC transporter substrate-binding protein [Brachybacterium fresconis]MBP2408369.1 iron complex transport system substrate-binding protein [Brachybacterium fresconis]